MSDRHRAEMAESKLRWIEEQCDTAVALGMNLDPRHILDTIHREVWDGYQTVDVQFGPLPDHIMARIDTLEAQRRPFDHKEP